MFYVYLIKSTNNANQTYVGYTQDLENRIKEHNRGECFHTAKFRPWKLLTYLAFDTQEKAINFERYLKSGAGRAFASKRLW